MTVSTEQISYDIGYFLLPDYLFKLRPRWNALVRTPSVVGPMLYMMACRLRSIDVDESAAAQYILHAESVAEGSLAILEYPTPAPADWRGRSSEEILASDDVLAPYFSIIFETPSAGMVYYVLGQAPVVGTGASGTTLRRVDLETNANLGPGPAPELSAVRELFHTRLAKMT